MSKPKELIELFGGHKSFAQKIGVHWVTPYKWERKGFIPTKYNQKILDSALFYEFNVKKAMACLDVPRLPFNIE